MTAEEVVRAIAGRRRSSSSSSGPGPSLRAGARNLAREELEALSDPEDARGGAGRRERPAERCGDRLWRYRRELAPFALAGVVLSLAANIHASTPRTWPAALPIGAALGALACRRLSRLLELVYAITVAFVAAAIAGTVWAGGLNLPIVAVACTLTLALALPWWWHQLPRGVIVGDPAWWRRMLGAKRSEAPREVRHRLRQVVGIWPSIAEALDLAAVRIQRAEADAHGWTMRVRLPAWLTVADMVGRIDRVEVAFRTRPGAVRVEADSHRADRCLLRVNIADPLAAPIAYPGPSAETVAAPIHLGVFEDRSAVQLRVADSHVLVAGVTGSGKSGLLNVLIGELAGRRDVALWGVDAAKMGVELGPWRSVFGRLATTPEDARELLSAASRVQQDRARGMAASGSRAWKATPGSPLLVVVVDELSEVASDPQAMTFVTALCRLGRQQGVLCVLATQRPTAEALGGLDSRGNVGVRIALRVEEPRDGDLILGAGKRTAGWQPDRLQVPGSFLIRGAGHGVPKPARAYLLPDPQVRDLAHRLGRNRPTVEVPDEAQDETAGLPAVVPTGASSTGLHDLLAEAGEDGMTAWEAGKALGRSRSWASEQLRGLVGAERVVAIGRGRYRLTAGSNVIALTDRGRQLGGPR